MIEVTVKDDSTITILHFSDWEAFYSFLYFFYGLKPHTWREEREVSYDDYGARVEKGFGYLAYNNPNDIIVRIPIGM